MVAHGGEVARGGLAVGVEGAEVEGGEGAGVGVFGELLAPGDGVAAEEMGGRADVCWGGGGVSVEGQNILCGLVGGGKKGNGWKKEVGFLSFLDLLMATSRK